MLSVSAIDHLGAWDTHSVVSSPPVGPSRCRMGLGGWRLGGPMYTVHTDSHPLHFYNSPETFCLYLEATIRERVCPQELGVRMSKWGVKGGGTELRARGILVSVCRSLSLFCSSLVSVRLLLSNALSGLGTVAHAYVIRLIGRSYNCSFPLLLVGCYITWQMRRPVFRKGAGAVRKSRH
jgi:hypothetical protein